ncbi:hypothetical protein ACWDR3_01390 [Streptomyces sp. NPDC001002]
MTTMPVADDQQLPRSGARGRGDAGRGRIASVVLDVLPGDPLS